jgi:LysR family transcriptional regulator, transcription activator of glutamate synthase operon
VDTDALRWFQQVADGMTVTEVGESGFITQSGVSRALARLEAEIGAPLFRRTGRLLRLTHAGATLKPHVDSLLAALDNGLAAVEQLIDPERGTVAVASQRTLSTWLVPYLVATFRHDHPDVRFELLPIRDELVTSTTADRRVDLEITTVRHLDRSVQWQPLLREPLWLAVPAGHRLADRTEVDLSEVADDPFLLLHAPSLLREQTETLCRHAGFTPTVVFEGDDVPTLRGFVGAGLGVCVVPALHQGTIDTTSAAVRHLTLRDAGASREIGVGWSTEHRMLPSADLFRRHIVELARADRLPGLAGSAPVLPARRSVRKRGTAPAS